MFSSSDSYRNVTLILEEIGSDRWWKLVEIPDDMEETEKISKIPYQTPDVITIYTFNEKNIPKLFLNVSKKG